MGFLNPKLILPLLCDADGILLLEVNRMLRAGGYFVWAAQPVYKHEEILEEQWKGITTSNFFFMVFLFKVVVFSSNIGTRESSDFGIEVHRKGSKTVSCLFLLTATISLADVTLLVFLT